MAKIKVTDKKATRIKYLQDDPIPDIDTSWQIDDETSYPGSRVEEFIKSQLRNRIGVIYYDGTTKQYKCFANTKDRDAYVNNPTAAANKVIASFDCDQESKDRLAGDTALQQAVDAEAASRESADTSLQQALDTETHTRTNENTALLQKINDEIKARGDSDTTLQNSLSAAQKSIDVLNKHMVTMVTLTETEYEALVTAGTVDDNTFYNILEE